MLCFNSGGHAWGRGSPQYKEGVCDESTKENYGNNVYNDRIVPPPPYASEFSMACYNLQLHGQFLIHVAIYGTTIPVVSIYLHCSMVKRNHSVTMVLPMVERLRNWPI